MLSSGLPIQMQQDHQNIFFPANNKVLSLDNEFLKAHQTLGFFKTKRSFFCRNRKSINNIQSSFISPFENAEKATANLNHQQPYSCQLPEKNVKAKEQRQNQSSGGKLKTIKETEAWNGNGNGKAILSNTGTSTGSGRGNGTPSKNGIKNTSFYKQMKGNIKLKAKMSINASKRKQQKPNTSTSSCQHSSNTKQQQSNNKPKHQPRQNKINKYSLVLNNSKHAFVSPYCQRIGQGIPQTTTSYQSFSNNLQSFKQAHDQQSLSLLSPRLASPNMMFNRKQHKKRRSNFKTFHQKLNKISNNYPTWQGEHDAINEHDVLDRETITEIQKLHPRKQKYKNKNTSRSSGAAAGRSKSIDKNQKNIQPICYFSRNSLNSNERQLILKIRRRKPKKQYENQQEVEINAIETEPDGRTKCSERQQKSSKTSSTVLKLNKLDKKRKLPNISYRSQVTYTPWNVVDQADQAEQLGFRRYF